MEAQMTETTLLEPARSRQHILNPDYWSGWPICPLKRSRGSTLDVGILLCYPVGSTTVYETNMFLVPERGTIGFLHQELEKGPKRVYANIDDLLKDGWRVD